MLTDKLTKEQQAILLKDLFGFNFEDTGNGHWVVFDEEGEEFYAGEFNCQFDFSTLAGFFSYQAHLSAGRAKREVLRNIRLSIGL